VPPQQQQGNGVKQRANELLDGIHSLQMQVGIRQTHISDQQSKAIEVPAALLHQQAEDQTKLLLLEEELGRLFEEEQQPPLPKMSTNYKALSQVRQEALRPPAPPIVAAPRTLSPPIIWEEEGD
jgi:hypothetical protein